MTYHSAVQKSLPESGTPAPTYPISSVNNALRLLLLFRQQRSVRLTEACQYLGVANSTAHRLLAMLAYHGFVQQEPGSRTYVAGPALVDVGLAVVQALDVREQARDTLRELAAEFDETAHLAVLEGRMVRFLDAVEGGRALRVTPRTGAMLPAHCTSVGKAMLSKLTADQLDQVYPPDIGALETRTKRSITSREQLRVALEKARRQGYAVNRAESEDGVGSVAIAFYDLRHQLASIAVAAPLSRLDKDRIATMADALKKAARALGENPRSS